MKSYAFDILLEGLDQADEALAERLYAALEVVLSSSGGQVRVSFSRNADSLEEAVPSAIRDLSKLGLTVRTVEVEPGVFA